MQNKFCHVSNSIMRAAEFEQASHDGATGKTTSGPPAGPCTCPEMDLDSTVPVAERGSVLIPKPLS
jgi:hypothetical protein